MKQVLDSTSTASSGANTAVAPELKKGVRMLMHHTRDTDQKQWNETRVHAMQVWHFYFHDTAIAFVSGVGSYMGEYDDDHKDGAILKSFWTPMRTGNIDLAHPGCNDAIAAAITMNDTDSDEIDIGDPDYAQ